jgi:alpha-glucosidase (family GH31 glycosyl hydrolase)
MVGEALLVAPILTPNTTERSVYLPEGTDWFNYWTGEVLPGGQTISVQAPLDHLPLFVKAGTVLPHWPLTQHTNQTRLLQTIHFHLFSGAGQSILYEDDGQGLDYRQGFFKRTLFICRPAPDRIILTTRLHGEYPPPYEIVTWTVYSPQPITPTAILADNISVADWAIGPIPNSITFQTPIIQRLEIRVIPP